MSETALRKQTRPVVPGGRPLSQQSVLPERERDPGFDPAAEAQSWQNELSDSAAARNPWKSTRPSADEAGAK